MTRWPIAVLVSLLALVLFAYTAGAKSGNAENGRQLYEDNCMSCHGKAGEGNPAMYKKAKAKIVHLGCEEAQSKSDDDIRKAITFHGSVKSAKSFTAADGRPADRTATNAASTKAVMVRKIFSSMGR